MAGLTGVFTSGLKLLELRRVTHSDLQTGGELHFLLTSAALLEPPIGSNWRSEHGHSAAGLVAACRDPNFSPKKSPGFQAGGASCWLLYTQRGN
jgi:hypothetical protein